MMTVKEALSRHGVARDAKTTFERKGDPAVFDAAWNSVVDIDYSPDTYSFAEALRLTMPFDAVPIVRGDTGVSAAFVVSTAAEVYVPGRDYMVQARAVWQKFEERKRMANNIKEGYGCDKSASWELAREIAKMPDASKVEQVAKLAGRMYKSLQGARKVPTNDPHEVKDVEVGGDIERLTADELTQLCTPGLDDPAAIRLLEKRSMQYRMKGKMAASRGPLVIALDESGSMHDDGYGNRNTWAKAAALALARVAHDGGRMVKFVHFAHVTAVTRCKPGDNQALLDMTRHFFSGGTNIALALAVAAREVGNLALEGYVGADVIVVTDGEDGSHEAQDKVLGLMQGQGVRLWTVLIECDLSEKAPLRTRASDVIRVGATDRADVISGLRAAAENVVSDDDKKANDARLRAMN
jgi:uncharacterized protein with von Willebrand factor type A (vWA) domain